MRGRLIVIAGTGTGIGKTHFAEALLLAWASSQRRVIGLKPIESGVTDGVLSDSARLEAASSFHVKRFGHAFSQPLSPHLAAREEGVEIGLETLANQIDAVRAQADGVVVELAGGLFTPLRNSVLNADWIPSLRPSRLWLVASDRLGVLHDVLACVRGVGDTPHPIAGIVLMAPARADESTGRNGDELVRLVEAPVLATFPRASPRHLSELPSFRPVIDSIG